MTLAVVTVVCSTDLKTRTHSADYLVPEMLKIDLTSGPYLMKVIRSIYSMDSNTHADKQCPVEAMLWGLVQVCLHARSLTLPGREIIPHSDISSGSEVESALLTDQEVTWTCLSDDVDLRLASLTLLTGTVN